MMGEMLWSPMGMYQKMVCFEADKGGSGSSGDAGGDGADGADKKTELESWESFLEGQSETVKDLYEEHTGALKRALNSEREQRAELSKQMKEAAKKLDEGSEARMALEEQAAKLEEAEQRAGFFEEAAKPEIGCTNPRLAFLAAQEIGAFDRRGNANWDALKKQFPELFKKTTPQGNAGSGTDGTPSNESGMNAFIRRAAGR